ncbi:VgrG-related protein [Streptomyces sp. NPDC098789]|uniref:VgrG-related protein n=1 Tax=Streptomyces sp. NPDC098789 TaxID=3366098 RepID=UPI003803021C
MTGRHTAGLDIIVNGTSILPKIAEVLAWVSVEEDGRTSAKAEIGFRDPRNASLFKKSGIELSSEIEVKAKTGSGELISVFKGEVTECEARASADTSGSSGHTGGMLTVIRGRDLSHRLRLGRRTAAYEGKTAGEIVKQVVERAHLHQCEVEDTGFQYEHLSQPGMSDWDFLGHLARENGRDLYFRDGKLHFKKRVPAGAGQDALLHFGDNLISVQTAASLAHQVPKVEVRGWDREGRKAVVSEARTPGGGAWGGQAKSSSAPYAPLVLTDLPRTKSASAPTAAAAVAKSMAEEVGAGLMRLHAVTRGEPKLRLRSVVKLKGLGEQFEGRFTVTKVRHHFHPVQGYRTELTVDEGGNRAVAGQPGDAEAGMRRIPGFMRGKVTDIKDPKKLGRVRVKLDCLDKDYVTTWAETVQLSGSRGHGVVLPWVGDVVAVVFEQGRLDSPLVVGAVDDPIDKVTHTMDLVDGGKGSPNLRTFASKNGHRLELKDADGSGTGATLTTGGDGKLKIQLDLSETVISIDSKGAVDIKAADGVSIDAGKGLLKLKGNSVLVSARQEISLEAGTVDVKARGKLRAHGALAEFSGDTVAKLTAAMVNIN